MKKMLTAQIIVVFCFILVAGIALPSKGSCAPVTYDISGHLTNYWLSSPETSDPDVQAARDAFAAGLNSLLWVGTTFNGTLIFDNAYSVPSWDPTYAIVAYSYNVTWESGLAFEATNYPWAGGGLINNTTAVPPDATRVTAGFIEGGYLTISGAADEMYNTSTTFEHALDLYGCPGLSELYNGNLGGDWAYYGPSPITDLMIFGYGMEIDSCAPASAPVPSTLFLLGTGLAGLAGTRVRKFLKK